MLNENWTITLTLRGPYGEHYETRMAVDGFTVRDKLVDIRPPGPFDLDMTFDRVVHTMKKREMRGDIFADACKALGKKLAQDMQDAEGWHDASRIEPMKRSLAGQLEPSPKTR